MTLLLRGVSIRVRYCQLYCWLHNLADVSCCRSPGVEARSCITRYSCTVFRNEARERSRLFELRWRLTDCLSICLTRTKSDAHGKERSRCFAHHNGRNVCASVSDWLHFGSDSGVSPGGCWEWRCASRFQTATWHCSVEQNCQIVLYPGGGGGGGGGVLTIFWVTGRLGPFDPPFSTYVEFWPLLLVSDVEYWPPFFQAL